jgi:RHS repeat-associated protein
MSYVREGRGKNQFLYNGKELVEGFELGWYDYGARYYAPDLGRFFTQDRFAEKYAGFSPYHYAANNPVLYIDVNGDSLALSGTNDAINKALENINSGLGGEYVSISDNGQLSLHIGEEQIANLSDEQKGLLNVVNDAISAEDQINIQIVESSKIVLIGSYQLEAIDIDDINAFGEGEAVNRFSTLGHEISEQQSKQLENKAYPQAHQDGFSAEEKITGFTRQPGLAPSSSGSQDSNGRITGNFDTIHTKNGRNIKVSTKIVKNNVIGVTRTNVN